MTDPHRPLPPADKTPGRVRPQIPETEMPVEDLIEGTLPGLPPATDPLLNPTPIPQDRPRRVID
jgi:hypothetical protein